MPYGFNNDKSKFDLQGIIDDTLDATSTNAIQNKAVATAIQGISPLIAYPVGSIYMSVNNTSPATLFGGTWQQLKDRFLLGAGDTYSNGTTGGEATHTLTENEIPSHRHSITVNWKGNTGDQVNGNAAGGNTNTGYTNYAGGGQAHNNMPPYLVVYMWKRTA